MSISYCCTIINIEKTTNIKYSILIATLQNNAIKVGMEKSTKKMFMSFRGLFLETKEFCPCNILSLHFLPLQFLHNAPHHCSSSIAPIAIIVPLLHLSLQLAQFKHS
jgi:hypothetical protein